MGVGDRTTVDGWMGKPSFPAQLECYLDSCSWKPSNLSSTHENHQSRFYEYYRKEAEEYDKEFMKKHGEDLDTTLIFVSSVCSPRPHVFIRS